MAQVFEIIPCHIFILQSQAVVVDSLATREPSHKQPWY